MLRLIRLIIFFSIQALKPVSAPPHADWHPSENVQKPGNFMFIRIVLRALLSFMFRCGMTREGCTDMVPDSVLLQVGPPLPLPLPPILIHQFKKPATSK